MTKENKNLIISYFFPPYTNTGGTVVAKRIIEKKEKVDILQNHIGNTTQDESLNNLLNQYINLRIILDAPYEPNWTWESIKSFINKGMEQLNNISKETPYTHIYSRSMPRQSHYLAYQYKQEYPETKWTAEFSDPIIFDIYGKERKASPINDPEYLTQINTTLENHKIQNLPKNTSTEYLCELLAYLFADEIIFTNNNQKNIMINKFQEIYHGTEPINTIIEEKSMIKPQPTLKKEYYNQTSSNYKINNEYVNLAYFGLFYGTRNFEDVFYALENIDETLKKYFKLHIFTSEEYFIDRSIQGLDTQDNIIINSNKNYLEFLNLTTKFDILLLTDANTKNYYQTNPYLPSKFSDYLGSQTDIWAICEKNSTLNQTKQIKYKSQLGKYPSSTKTLNKIIKEKLEEKKYKVTGQTPTPTKKENETNIIKHLEKRNMTLTNTLHEEIKTKQNEINKLNQIIQNLEKQK